MKFAKLVSKNPLEIVLAVVLIIFILSPIEPPASIANIIDSTLGIIVTSVLIVYLFVYSHTLLAILFVVAVFELIRRSSARRQFQPAVVTYTALQPTMAVYQAPPVMEAGAADGIAPTARHASSRSQTGRPEKAFQPTASANIEQEVEDTALMGPPETRRPGGQRRPAQQPRNQMVMNNAAVPSHEAVMQPPLYDHSNTQFKKDRDLASMNKPLMHSTLEEEAVHSMPMPNIEQDYLDSSYKPVYGNIHQAAFA